MVDAEKEVVDALFDYEKKACLYRFELALHERLVELFEEEMRCLETEEFCRRANGDVFPVFGAGYLNAKRCWLEDHHVVYDLMIEAYKRLTGDEKNIADIKFDNWKLVRGSRVFQDEKQKIKGQMREVLLELLIAVENV